MKYSKEIIASSIEYTVLNATVTEKDIFTACEDAIRHACKAIVLNSGFIKTAARSLEGSDVILCSSVGFPLGASSTEAKMAEAQAAVRDGAREINVVLHIGAMIEHNMQYIYDDIRAVVEAVDGVHVKVTIETSHFNDDDKIMVCELMMRAGAKSIVTSTGFGTDSVKVSDVALIRRCVGNDFGVIATGGITTPKDVAAMFEAGANRIGTSYLNEIMKQFK